MGLYAFVLGIILLYLCYLIAVVLLLLVQCGDKMASFSFRFSMVGRGVLRFLDARYRKPRSNFTPFFDFGADSRICGVDIIY